MNEDKMKRLLEMQEHPERYSEEEIRQLMADEECRQLYEQMVKATDSVFAENHKSHALSKRPTALYKIAAVFIGLLMLSGIAYAAVRIVSSSRSQQTEVCGNHGGNQGDRSLDSDGKAVDQGPVPLIPPVTPDSIPQIRIFENAPLDEMITEIAHYYNKVADIESEEAHELRLYYKWEPKDAIEDVVADLNHFDHVSLAIEDDKLIVKP